MAESPEDRQRDQRVQKLQSLATGSTEADPTGHNSPKSKSARLRANSRNAPGNWSRLPTDDSIRLTLTRLLLVMIATASLLSRMNSKPGASAINSRATTQRFSCARARRLNQPSQVDPCRPCFRDRELGRTYAMHVRPRHPLCQRMTTARPPALFGRRTTAGTIRTRIQFVAFLSHRSCRKRNPRRSDGVRHQQLPRAERSRRNESGQLRGKSKDAWRTTRRRVDLASLIWRAR